MIEASILLGFNTLWT